MNHVKPLLGTVITLALLIQVQAQDPFTNGLVAYYSFNGNANDLSGHGNNGIVAGATLTADRFGNPNSAYYFAGDGSDISIPDSPSLDMTNALSLTAWVKIEAGGLAQPRILHKHVFDLDLSDTSGNPQLGLSIQNYPSGGASVGNAPLQSGQWTFLAGTYDRQTLRLYTNGMLAAQVSANVPIDTNALPIGIGRNLESGSDWFKGYIDDVRIYNRALLSNEVAQLYAIESAPRVDLIKAVKPSFSNLIVGRNYQLQLSENLNTWTNQGAAFPATNNNMIYPQYFDVGNWGQLFFRAQVVP